MLLGAIDERVEARCESVEEEKRTISGRFFFTISLSLLTNIMRLVIRILNNGKPLKPLNVFLSRMLSTYVASMQEISAGSSH